ncbi:hypothetical protein ACF06X_04570 [Streptomyces sp. NPDC015346]|uniref:hypothetical protein n=1 Tax=Streptomyces sp. NPDC015346 TaxID=3364954 RepID=UPI0036FE3496
MAKNKNQNRSQKEQSPAERGTQEAQKSAMESQSERAAQVTPGDMARKGRQKRFGHN